MNFDDTLNKLVGENKTGEILMKVRTILSAAKEN